MVVGDLADIHLLENLFAEYAFDGLMHFTANSLVGESMISPVKYYRNNVANTLNLLDVMVRHNVKHFIFSSTAAIFGEPEYSPIYELHPQKPINPYGSSKLMVEGMLQDYTSAYGLNSVCLRYFNACGADPEGEIGECHDPETHLIYRVNDIGSLNLLDALCQLDKPFRKVILASSATVYGNVQNSVLSEALCPKRVSHYGCSKLAMEHMAQNYVTKLPVLITRPFNYTGIGHAEHFLIPKIVKSYQENKSQIELGNLNVSREFNDVRDVCKIYLDLLLSNESGVTINVCSGKTVSLMRVISLMDDIAGYEMRVKVNPAFVRENEIKDLSGDVSRLNQLIQPKFDYRIEDTLRWMHGSSK